jgi:hypothetical protein
VKCLGTITEFGTNAFVDVYGFDLITELAAADWEESSMLGDLSATSDTLPEFEESEYGKEWWYEKLAFWIRALRWMIFQLQSTNLTLHGLSLNGDTRQ